MVIKSAEILCVGTEILIGDIVNTNAAWLSKQLCEMGISQYHQAVIGDNSERLAVTVSQTLSNCDLLIITGGLGPTYDDITKETVAQVLGKELVRDGEILERIKSYFRKRGKTMTQNNEKQADIIEGAIAVPNDVGTAPGLICTTTDDKMIVLMPGPPSEMQHMWQTYVKPEIAKHCEKVFVSKNINIVGIGESSVANALEDMMKSSVNPTIAPYCSTAETRLRVTASANTHAEAQKLCDKAIEEIKQSSIGKHIYGIDTTIPETVVKLLTENNLKIAVAESCTGGLVSKMITDVPGSSEVFEGSIISYSNRIKNEQLGISYHVLEKYGAVDHHVASLMAENVKRIMGADIGIGITGIAGPGGGSGEKPVGLVYISVCCCKRTKLLKFKYSPKSSREKIRELAATNALIMAMETIKKAREN